MKVRGTVIDGMGRKQVHEDTVVPTERKVERIMALIDREGGSPLPLAAWIEMLTQIRSECQSRIQAAQDDLRRARS